jgi:hypothetical protein
MKEWYFVALPCKRLDGDKAFRIRAAARSSSGGWPRRRAWSGPWHRDRTRSRAWRTRPDGEDPRSTNLWSGSRSCPWWRRRTRIELLNIPIRLHFVLFCWFCCYEKLYVLVLNLSTHPRKRWFELTQKFKNIAKMKCHVSPSRIVSTTKSWTKFSPDWEWGMSRRRRRRWSRGRRSQFRIRPDLQHPRSSCHRARPDPSCRTTWSPARPRPWPIWRGPAAPEETSGSCCSGECLSLLEARSCRKP